MVGASQPWPIVWLISSNYKAAWMVDVAGQVEPGQKGRCHFLLLYFFLPSTSRVPKAVSESKPLIGRSSTLETFESC